jgi:hypothetical protein
VLSTIVPSGPPIVAGFGKSVNSTLPFSAWPFSRSVPDHSAGRSLQQRVQIEQPTVPPFLGISCIIDATMAAELPCGPRHVPVVAALGFNRLENFNVQENSLLGVCGWTLAG